MCIVCSLGTSGHADGAKVVQTFKLIPVPSNSSFQHLLSPQVFNSLYVIYLNVIVVSFMQRHKETVIFNEYTSETILPSDPFPR